MQSCTCGFMGFLNTGGSAAKLKHLQNLHHADFLKSKNPKQIYYFKFTSMAF